MQYCFSGSQYLLTLPSLATKLRLCRVFILPVILCGAETWSSTRQLSRNIDAFDQWCLRCILRISWGPYFKWRGLQTTDQPPLTLTYIILTTHLKFSIQHWSGSCLSSSTTSTGMEVARGIATSTGQATVMIMTNINDTTKRHILAWVRVVWAVESVERSDVQTSFQIQRGLSKFCYNSPICQQPAWTDFH